MKHVTFSGTTRGARLALRRRFISVLRPTVRKAYTSDFRVVRAFTVARRPDIVRYLRIMLCLFFDYTQPK